MKKKFLKVFFLYSYISLVCYVGSENALNMAKWMNKKKNGDKKAELKAESLWKASFERFKETIKIIMET